VLLYDTGSPRVRIASVRAVPGVVAIGVRARTGRNGLLTVVSTFTPELSGKPVVASGYTLSDGRGGSGCGGIVTLEDLEADGSVVTEEAVDPCGRGRARSSSIRSYDPDGQSRTLWRAGVVGALDLLKDEKRASLEGNRLLIWSLSLARLVNLPAASSRLAMPSEDKTVLYQVDADRRGRLVAAELTVRDRATEARVRSVAGRPRGGAVLSRTRARLPDARFCGSALVVWSAGDRGRQRLAVRGRGSYRGAAAVPDGKLRGFACDAGTYVRVAHTGRRRAVVDVFRLPPP
jgi:hypothetical protein